MNMLKVYLADDHAVVRSGMMRLLKSFARVQHVKEVGNGRELLTLMEQHVPHVVILDIEMPVMGGMECAKYILEHFPQVKILMLTMHMEDVFVVRMLDLGVHGFLSKNSSAEELEKALYAVVDKDFYRNEMVTRVLKRLPARKQNRSDYYKLSPRELEILLLICDELSPVEISERLQISEKTYFNHRYRILEKTGAKNSVGLVKYAIDNGLYKLEVQ
ncbi:MAG: response regulator transcription factor [Flammeovirgaceae bacterium]|nr:MAG: response regulator transcription factor [Flammeovirgaceae bacterium]